MKFWTFFLLFILICLSLVYTPFYKSKIGTFGPGCERTPEENNNRADENSEGGEFREEDASEEQTNEESCFSGDEKGFVIKSNEQTEFEFFYENTPTNWKFSSDFTNVYIFTLNNKNIITEAENSILHSSLENCKFYTFDFKRKQGILKKEMDFVKKISGGDKELCLYKEKESPGLIESISSLGGKPLSKDDSKRLSESIIQTAGGDAIDLKKFCKIPTLENGECLKEAICEIEIKEGGKEKFGYLVEEDDCGNFVVNLANNGKDISEREERFKEKMLEDCSVKNKESLRIFNFENFFSANEENIIISRTVGSGKPSKSCVTDEKGKTECSDSPIGIDCAFINQVNFIVKDNDSKVLLEKTANRGRNCDYRKKIETDNYNKIGTDILLDLEVTLKNGKKEYFKNVAQTTIEESYDLDDPNPLEGYDIIKGTGKIYTTNPLNFFILVGGKPKWKLASLEKTWIEIRDGKNILDEVDLNIEEIYEEGVYLLKGNYEFYEEGKISDYQAILHLIDKNGEFEILLDPKQWEILEGDINCELIHNSNLINPINTIFITQGFSEEDLLNSDFLSLPENLLNIIPFKGNSDIFNFYVLKSTIDNEKFEDLTDVSSLIFNECGLNVDEVHEIVNLVKTKEGNSYAYPNMGWQKIVVATPQNDMRSSVYVHETGHSLGGLADEYWAEYNNSHLDFEVPNDYGHLSYNIDVEGCPKWCEGTLDETSEFYPYYSGWKDCVKSISFNRVDGEFVEAEKLTNCWEEWDEKSYKNTGVWLANINLGKNCIEGTDCYFTAKGVKRWRSIKNGIMNRGKESFGIISEKRLIKKIEEHKTAEKNIDTDIVFVNTFDEDFRTYSHIKKGQFYNFPESLIIEDFDDKKNPLSANKVNLLELKKREKIKLAEKIRNEKIDRGIEVTNRGVNKLIPKSWKRTLAKTTIPIPERINVNEIDFSNLLD